MSSPNPSVALELDKGPELYLDPAMLAPDLRDEETRFEVARQLIEFAIAEPYNDTIHHKHWGFLLCAHIQLHNTLDPDMYEVTPDEDAPTMRENVEAELIAVQQGMHEYRQQDEARRAQGPSIRFLTAKEAMEEAGEKWPWYYRVLDWLNS